MGLLSHKYTASNGQMTLRIDMDLDIHEQYFQISDEAEILAQFNGKEDASLLVILPSPCPQLALVQKILSAINIQDLNQVKQLHLKASDGISLFNLLKDGKVKQIISFGFPVNQLGIHVDHSPYSIIDFKGIQMIVSADLEVVSNNADHKKALWGALKKWVVSTPLNDQ